MRRNVSLSVRISEEDADFLARYDAAEAKTPSDKIRAILAEARRRQEGAEDFTGCVENVEDMLRPALARLRQLQRDEGVHADFLLRLYERMPEIMAELVTGVSEQGDKTRAMAASEQRVGEHVFRLLEDILNFLLTSRTRTQTPRLMEDKVAPILEILALIEMKQSKAKEPNHG